MQLCISINIECPVQKESYFPRAPQDTLFSSEKHLTSATWRTLVMVEVNDVITQIGEEPFGRWLKVSE